VRLGRGGLARALLLVGAFFAFGTLVPACRNGSESRSSSAIALSPCHLTGASAQVVDAMCGTLTVPEDRASTAKGGRTIDLAIAIVRATGRRAAPDALFLLAGGPGQSALDVYPAIAGSFSRVNLTRDIVLVDQRGTGRSGPLACAQTEVEGTTVDPAEGAALAARCRRGLEQHADLRRYTTAIAMDDLDDVRAALGYETIDLYGASYGTRAALVYLRRHERHVRAVVVDGVAPPDWALAASFATDGQRAIDQIFARCAADPDCNRAFPDLPASLTALLTAHAKPESVVVSHPTTATPTTVLVSRESIASTLHALTYESETAALLPLLVHWTQETGDLRPLAAQSLIMADSLKLAVGEHFAVACSEDAPFLDPAAIAAQGASSYLGDAPARRYIEACKGWPRANLTPEDRAPVVSNVPVLLLSGAIDPVTPPSNAAAAARTLANSYQVTVPGEGHGALQRSCTRRIVDDFIERASVAGLSADCLHDAKPMRFFTSFAGPQP
jgi:pimeloyl-ACP methyl ester carboxylesterase